MIIPECTIIRLPVCLSASTTDAQLLSRSTSRSQLVSFRKQRYVALCSVLYLQTFLFCYYLMPFVVIQKYTCDCGIKGVDNFIYCVKSCNLVRKHSKRTELWFLQCTKTFQCDQKLVDFGIGWLN